MAETVTKTYKDSSGEINQCDIYRDIEFIEYVKFMKDILDEYVNIVGKGIEKRIENNKDKYIKNFSPNNTVDYQYRIGGYLAERLTNVFIMNKHKKMMSYAVNITENKYKRKKIAEEEKQVKQQPVKITEESKESIYGQ